MSQEIENKEQRNKFVNKEASKSIKIRKKERNKKIKEQKIDISTNLKSSTI